MKKANTTDIEKVLQTKEDPKRTTFNLTPNAHEFISYLAKSLRIRKKEVFDRFVQMIDVLNLDKDAIANLMGKGTVEDTVRKTYVIDTKVLRRIEQISKKSGCRRDILIEMLAIGLKEWIDSEKRQRTPVIEETVKRMNDLWSEISCLEEDLRKIFDGDNKIFEYFSTIDYGFDMGLQLLNEELKTN